MNEETRANAFPNLGKFAVVQPATAKPWAVIDPEGALTHFDEKAMRQAADAGDNFARFTVALLEREREELAKPDIGEMTSRFLGWRLPDEFHPDAGVSFTAPENKAWWPTGTNLLTYDQAKAMFEHVVGAKTTRSAQDLIRALERAHAGQQVGHDQSDQPNTEYSRGYDTGFGGCIAAAKRWLLGR